MKLTVYIDTDLVGCNISEEIEIPDEDLEDLNEQEREKVCSEYATDWMWTKVHLNWELP